MQHYFDRVYFHPIVTMSPGAETAGLTESASCAKALVFGVSINTNIETRFRFILKKENRAGLYEFIIFFTQVIVLALNSGITPQA